MIEVEFKSVKKVIIHEAVKHDIKGLVRLRILGLRRDSVAQPLVWAEGVLFIRAVMPLTKDIIKQRLEEGIVHFDAIEWALMPKFKKVLRSEGVTIPVLNGSDNTNLRDIAKALKKRRG